MFTLALDGSLEDWAIDLDRLPVTADFVARVVRDRYPRLDIPVHARWRHFQINTASANSPPPVSHGVPRDSLRSGGSGGGQRDLWRELAESTSWASPAAKARSAFDLAITSVLLDAGAGPGWQYRDIATGLTAKRSEGLALASLRWFECGGLSADKNDSLRVDASALEHIDAATMRDAFQATPANPLLGTEGRASLLNRLGTAVRTRPELFAIADSPRPGGLFDALARRAAGKPLPAAAILETLLDAFGPIWQHRPSLGGVALGDCWPHPALEGADPADGYAPLHKLSQWLTYSLIEPLENAGIAVCDIQELTGLAEYRNGGLFVDMGVMTPRDGAAWTKTHAVSSPFVVGWRCMTVALLDRIAPLVSARLGLDPENFPLPRVLEGGTWAAGRIVAREKRADGGPPFQISSDGTVF
jgi:hypothetical protein